jgi:hypothetical protein
MTSEKEAEELDQWFEAVLDELLTLITSFDSSSDKLFEHIVTLQKEARNVCRVLPVKQLKTDSGRFEMEPVLPKADIDRLRFNQQEVNAYFEKGDDGWYYSENILFLSVRNVRDDNRRDALKEYLNTIEIRAQLAEAFGLPPEDVEVSLSQESRGVKKYHGVDWWLCETLYFTQNKPMEEFIVLTDPDFPLEQPKQHRIEEKKQHRKKKKRRA